MTSIQNCADIEFFELYPDATEEFLRLRKERYILWENQLLKIYRLENLKLRTNKKRIKKKFDKKIKDARRKEGQYWLEYCYGR